MGSFMKQQMSSRSLGLKPLFKNTNRNLSTTSLLGLNVPDSHDKKKSNMRLDGINSKKIDSQRLERQISKVSDYQIKTGVSGQSKKNLRSRHSSVTNNKEEQKRSEEKAEILNKDMLGNGLITDLSVSNCSQSLSTPSKEKEIKMDEKIPPKIVLSGISQAILD